MAAASEPVFNENGQVAIILVHSGLVRIPTLATIVPAAGLRLIMIGVPVSYPPVSIPGGICVSCFLAPTTRAITWPPEVQAEILECVGGDYVLDVTIPDGVVPDRSALAERIRRMDAQRFDVAIHLMRSRSWDVLFVVCMGTDRVAHYFMRYADASHVRHEPDERYLDVMRDHYVSCDRRLADVIEAAGGGASVMVVSDHGVQRLDGRVAVNEWLRRAGYLHLRSSPSGRTPLRDAHVDWSRTRAWAQGFGGQIFVNQRGREPRGIVDPEDVPALVSEIAGGLRDLRSDNGRAISVHAIERRGLYDGPLADRCPDLFLELDEMRYLTTNAVGVVPSPVDGLRGTDDASHTRTGFFALAGPQVPPLGRFAALEITDVLPTILEILGVDAPELPGRAIQRDKTPFRPDDEAVLTARLRSLYLE